jgi:hypothetical protein
MPLPRFPEIDLFSYGFGFATAALLALLLFLFRRQLAAGRAALGLRLRGLRDFLTAGTERRWREDVLQFAQTNHLAGSLFALDEILLPPRLIVPQPPFDPTAPPADEESVDIIPILPEWPELAALYGVATIGVAEALAAGNSLLILAPPGNGKTTTLAHLASAAAHGDPHLFPEGCTPILVHAADLSLPRADGEDAAAPLISAATTHASAVTTAQLPRHLRRRLADSACVVFIDGLDELAAAQIAECAAWLRDFRRAYAQHRVVVAAGITGYGPLLTAGLAPVLMAPWSGDDYRGLMQKWVAAWERYSRLRKRRSATTDTDAAPIAATAAKM